MDEIEIFFARMTGVRRLFTLFIVVLSAAVTAVGAQGFMPVRNFSRDVYRGGHQNWSLTQDSLGRVYVGNRDGMLQFDGQRWMMWTLANGTTVRSVMYDADECRVYAGGSDEFGYFAPDPESGILSYNSLLPLVHNHSVIFNEIWNIYRYKGCVWFQSDFHLICYDGKDITVHGAGGRISRSAPIGDYIYVALDDGSILRYDGTVYDTLSGCGVLSGKQIVALLPCRTPGDILIATSVDGLYIYDGASVRPFELSIDRFLRDNQVFCASLNGDNYVFGTVTHGAVVYNVATGNTQYINKESGLQNNTVLAAVFDREGNIWFCLDNGLDYAMLTSPFTTIVGAANEVGAGYASILWGDRMLFGTNQGLYSARYPFESSPSPVGLHRELQGQVWSLTASDNTLFVGSDAGMYFTEGGGFSRIDGLSGTYKAQALPHQPQYALASTYNKFYLLERQGDGWVNRGSISGYDDIGGQFVIDGHGYIWLSHWRKGVYRLHLDVAGRRFDESVLYDSRNGLPADRYNTVLLQDGNVVISSEGGYYAYDYRTCTLARDNGLSDAFGPEVAAFMLNRPDGHMVGLAGHTLLECHAGATGLSVVDSISLRPFADMLLPGFMHLNYVGPHSLIVSNQDGFWNIDTEAVDGPRLSRPFVSTVLANRDSLVYMAPMNPEPHAALELPHALNSLMFEFACADYAGLNAVEFSSYLENYDKDWTPFVSESTREYTRLFEGTYILHLRSRDSLGNIEETQLRVVILPPWYRSLVAKIIYAVLVLMLIWLAYLMLRRWHRKAQLRLEQRKEQELRELRDKSEQDALIKNHEIATLKSEQLEQDIKHKSQELSSTTMNLIRKNEVLRDIAARLQRVQQIADGDGDRGELKGHVDRIRSAIEENISHDDDWDSFTRNFDVVYENFIKILKERHPNLTLSDIRMCCYIKMGLSSKEIAPLVNISYKSVEMARYRLRKKMELPTETTLSDYLASGVTS